VKKLFFLALIAAAAWYGWHHYRDILDKSPSNKAIIVNTTGHEMTRVRLSAGSQSIGVKESIPDNGRAEFPFKVDTDAAFTLVWQYSDRQGERHWTGGTVTRGPVVQKCTFTVDADDQVIFLPENFSSAN
jgi:hypothetical protein